MHRKWLCVPAALCLAMQFASARNIFVTSVDPSSPILATYNTEPFSFGASTGSVSGAFAVLPTSNPQKFYLISRVSTDTVAVLEGRFPTVAITKRIQVGGEATAADVTPDGRRVVVVGPGGVSVVDTGTDNAIFTMGIVDAGPNPVDVATSIDSSRAYIVSNASTRITALNLTNNTVAGTASLPSTASAVSVGPNGVVYVSAPNAIYEIDPYTLATRAVINLSGTADTLQFTPDGAFAIARNLSSVAGRATILIDLSKRTVADAPAAGPVFTRLVLVDNRVAYAVSALGQLFVLNIGSSGALTQTAVPITDVSSIQDIAGSGEIPRAQYLILLAGSSMYRFEISTGTVSGPISAPNNRGSLTAVTPVTTGSVAGLLTFNATQTAAAGTSSLPMVLRAYGPNGLPVSGAAVQFTVGTAGVTLNSTSAATDSSGYASTRVSIPSSLTTGTLSVTATAGGRTASFTITIGNPQLPGGTTSNVQSGLIITAGQGQAVSEYFSTAFQEPLQVRLLDSSGNPVSNAVITWALAQGSGSVAPQQSTTDSSGYATSNFTSSGIQPGIAYLTNTISATAPSGQTVTFYVTGIRRLRDSPGTLTPQLLAPSNTVINGNAGDVIPGAIQFKVTYTSDGTPVPYIGMRISSGGDPTLGPSASCRGGTVFSDQNGNISCDLVIGPRPGNGLAIQALVGSVTRYDFTLNVAPGGASDVRFLSNGALSGNPGQTLPSLVVQVADAGGNILQNIPVMWDIPSTFRIVSLQGTTDINGRAGASLMLPQTPGVYTVRARAGTGTATITVTVNAVAGSLALVSGNQQSAVAGQAFQPIVVKVLDAQGNALPGASVNFSVTSGSASLSSTTVQSGADGTAAVTVTAGSAVGAIEVTATSGSASVKLNLTARLPGPSFTASSILSAGGYQPGVSPGSLAYIKATGIAPNLRGSVTPSSVVGPLPTTLADVQVLFNDIAAPIYAVSNVNGEESVIVQVPFEVVPGTASVAIRTANAGSTTVANVPIYAVKPGIFTTIDSSGVTYAVATRGDGSYVTSVNPVRRGDTIRLFVTGLGATTGGLGTNQAGVPNQPVAATVIAGVGRFGIRVISAESLQGAIGVYMVAVEVPLDLDLQQAGPGTAKPIGLAVAGPDGQFVYANYVTLPVI